MSYHITKRHCHYCNAPITTAFYLPDPRAWACVDCYFSNALTARTGVATDGVILATEGTIDACLDKLEATIA